MERAGWSLILIAAVLLTVPVITDAQQTGKVLHCVLEYL
jgi:hypothetical protein